MERASRACFNRIIEIADRRDSFIIFAGPGNNGGDGFAIARMLSANNRNVKVYHFTSPAPSKDCEVNRERWVQLRLPLIDVNSEEKIPGQFGEGKVIIDAIFGTGQSRPMEGLYALACQAINNSGLPVISIDLPSGVNSDESSVHQPRIRASYTLSLQAPKLCFFVPENHDVLGKVEILDIGLKPDFYAEADTVFETIDEEHIKSLIRPRNAFAHKGNFGQALLLAGSRGMIGAALMAAKACLRTGVGKLFCAIPSPALPILQSAIPEAICIPDPSGDRLSRLPDDMKRFTAVGAGPGMGKDMATRQLVRDLISQPQQPLVLDADALNIIAEDGLIQNLPPDTVITPHLGEFSRLFGTSANDFDRLRLALDRAKQQGIYIILKGRYTLIATPEGKGYFNLTGNPGMAKGGSGDVLTGMITGFLAQSYPVPEACKLAVCLHGIAGDLARDRHSEHAMLPTDIIDEIGDAFKKMG